MSRRAAACLALGVAALLLTAVPGLPRPGQSASTTMRVSVNVVRACSVTTPGDASQPLSASPDVRIRCSRTASSYTAGLQALASTTVPAVVETSRIGDSLMVSVSF